MSDTVNISRFKLAEIIEEIREIKEDLEEYLKK